MSKRNDLITRANALELTFAKNISNKNLEALIVKAEAEQNTSAGPDAGEVTGGEISAPTAGANEGGPERLTPASVDAAGETTPVQQGAATTPAEEAGAAPSDIAPTKTVIQDAPPDAADVAEKTNTVANGETFTIPSTVLPLLTLQVTDALSKEITVVVKGPAEGRWRAGRKWGADPVSVPIDEMSEDQLLMLVGDPTLTIEMFQGDEKVADAAHFAALRDQ